MIRPKLFLTFALLIGMLLVAASGRSADADHLRNQGAGMYNDSSSAGQNSFFTINPQMVSCGVGSTDSSNGIGVPFAMQMYAIDIESYHADHKTRTITASGRMRSTTVVNGSTAEDALHDFLAIAADNGTGPDRFDIHFHTPFWNTSNPFCTPSTVIPGDCRFGGNVILGEVTVSPGSSE